LLSASALARPSKPSATVTNTLTSEYRSESPGDNDDRYGVFIDRLNIVGSAGAITTNVRIDSVYFIDSQTDGTQSDARVERMIVRYNLGRLKLTLGDYFRQLGRGVVLSLRKVDELGVDVTLRGALLEYSGSRVATSAFAGRTNPTNIDLVNQRFLEDPDDIMTGGHVRIKAADGLYVGAHGLFVERETPILPDYGEDRSYTGGVTFELPAITEWLSVYGEANVQRIDRAGGEPHYATGNYLTVDIQPMDWAILVEGLLLDGLQDAPGGFDQIGSLNGSTGERFRYNQIPTLERIDQELLDAEDVVGARLRVERFFLEGDLAIHVNGLFKSNNRSEAAERLQYHGFGGVEYVYGGGRSRITTSAGYREDIEVATDRVGKSLTHVDLDWTHAIGGGYGVHLQSFNQDRRVINDGSLLPQYRGSTLLAGELSGLGSLTFEFGFDTQARGEADEDVTLYYAGILQWHVNDWLQIKSTVGSQRGGLKCIAGVCRVFAEFKGARLDLVIKQGLGSW
jgi:hypothetical protein